MPFITEEILVITLTEHQLYDLLQRTHAGVSPNEIMQNLYIGLSPDKQKEFLNRPFGEVLLLLVRTTNCLEESGIRTIGDIIRYSKTKKLMSIPKFGEKSFQNVVEQLAVIGLSLDTHLPE